MHNIIYRSIRCPALMLVCFLSKTLRIWQNSGGDDQNTISSTGGITYGSGVSAMTSKPDEEITWTKEQQKKSDESTALLSLKPHIPRQNPILWCFHVLEGFTIFVSICLIATQVLPLFLAQNIFGQIGYLSLALRLYVSLFLVLIIATELNILLSIIQSSMLLQNFFSRGILYTFLGLICVQEGSSEQLRDILAHHNSVVDSSIRNWTAIFMQISSWCMLAVGVVYTMLGMCCLQRVRNARKAAEKQAWRDYRRDLKRWKQQAGN